MEENTNSDIDLTELEQEEINQKAQSLGVSTESLEEHFKRLKSLATKSCEAGLSGLQLSQEEKEAAKDLLLSNIHREFFERIDRDGIERVQDIISDIIIEKEELSQSEFAIGQLIGAENVLEDRNKQSAREQAEYTDTIVKTMDDLKEAKKEEMKVDEFENHRVNDTNMDPYYTEIANNSLNDFIENLDNLIPLTEKQNDAYSRMLTSDEFDKGRDYLLHNLSFITGYATEDEIVPYDQIPEEDVEKMLEELYVHWRIVYDSGRENSDDEMEAFKAKVVLAKKVLPPEYFDDENLLNVNYFLENYLNMYRRSHNLPPDAEVDLNEVFEDAMSWCSDERTNVEFLSVDDMKYEHIATHRYLRINRLVKEWVNGENGRTEDEVLTYMSKNIPGLLKYLESLDEGKFIKRPGEDGLYPKGEMGRLIADTKMKHMQDLSVDLLLEAYGREKQIDIAEGREGTEKFADEFTDESCRLIFARKIIVDVLTTGRADPEFIKKALKTCPSVLKAAIKEVTDRSSDLIKEENVGFTIGLENILTDESQVETLLNAEPMVFPTLDNGNVTYSPYDMTDIDKKLVRQREEGRYGEERDYSIRSNLISVNRTRMAKAEIRSRDTRGTEGTELEGLSYSDSSEIIITDAEFKEYRDLVAEYQSIDKKDFISLCNFARAHHGLPRIDYLDDKVKSINTGHKIEDIMQFHEGIKRLKDALVIVQSIAVKSEDIGTGREVATIARMKKLAISSPEAFIDAIDYMKDVDTRKGSAVLPFKRPLEEIDKIKTGYMNIVNSNVSMDNKKEMIMQYTKANPELMSYVIRDYQAKHNIPGISDEIYEYSQEAFRFVTKALEFENAITSTSYDDRTLRTSMSLLSQEQVDYVRQRIEADNRKNVNRNGFNKKS